MAILEVSTQRANTSGTGTVATITWPATPANGNLMVVALTWSGTGTLTPPAGWAYAKQGGSTAWENGILYKVAGAAEPTTAAFTLSVSRDYVANGANFSGFTSLRIDKTITALTSPSVRSTGAIGILSNPNSLYIAQFSENSAVTHSAYNNSQVEIADQTNVTCGNALASLIVTNNNSLTLTCTPSASGAARSTAVVFSDSGPMTGTVAGFGFTASGTLANLLLAGAVTGFGFTMSGVLADRNALIGSANFSFSLTGSPVASPPKGGVKFRQVWGDLEQKKTTLLNAIYAKTKLLSEQSQNVLNPSFENGQVFWTASTWAANGWSIIGPYTTPQVSLANLLPLTGTFVLQYNNLAAPQNIANSGRFQCSAGKRIACTIGYFRNVFIATGGAEIWFYDATGTYISKDGQMKDMSLANSGEWSTVKSVAVAPVGSAYCSAALSVTAYTSGAAYFDKVELAVDSVTADPINTANLGSRWTPSNMITYTCPTSGTTQTISVAAGTLTMGDLVVSYNASSGVVTQARSTTVLYYVYYLDPTLTGGTKALNISTNGDDLVANNGNVFVGTVSVVVPAAATGGGGGGDPGGGCVDVLMFVAADALAGRVKSGDFIECSMPDPNSCTTQMLQVKHNTLKIQPCFRIVSESGAAVVASESTPMTLRDGTVVYIPQMLGKEVLVKDDDGLRWERVVSCKPTLGYRPVAFISVNENCYFAGEVADKRIATHNVTYKP